MTPRKEFDPEAWPEAAVFVKNLTAARYAAGLSQRQLADVTGLDASYIGLLERRRANPSLQVMIVLARAVSVSLVDLLSSDETDGQLVDRQADEIHAAPGGGN